MRGIVTGHARVAGEFVRFADTETAHGIAAGSTSGIVTTFAQPAKKCWSAV